MIKSWTPKKEFKCYCKNLKQDLIERGIKCNKCHYDSLETPTKCKQCEKYTESCVCDKILKFKGSISGK